MAKFIEIQPNVHINVDHICSTEFRVAAWDASGKNPYKHEIVTTMSNGRVFQSKMGSRSEIEPLYDMLVSQLNV